MKTYTLYPSAAPSWRFWRGMFRLWVIVSVIWCSLVWLMLGNFYRDAKMDALNVAWNVEHYVPPTVLLAAGPVIRPTKYVGTYDTVAAREQVDANAHLILGMMVIPCGALLLLGTALRWAFSGFRQ